MANPPKSQCIALIGSIFAVTAFILMWMGSIRCNFLKFASVAGASTQSFDLKLGVWYYQYWSLLFSTSGTYVYESCNIYPDFTDIDAAWKAARAFTIISFIFSTIMLVVACVSGFACNKGYALTHVWEAPAYLLTAICQGLVLLLLSSNACKSDVLFGLGGPALINVTFEETCSISTGAKLVISATVFWFCAAVASFFAHRAERAETSEEGGEVFKGEPGEVEKEGDAEKAAEEGDAEKAEEEGDAVKAAEEADPGKVVEEGEAEKVAEEAGEAQ